MAEKASPPVADWSDEWHRGFLVWLLERGRVTDWPGMPDPRTRWRRPIRNVISAAVENGFPMGWRREPKWFEVDKS